MSKTQSRITSFSIKPTDKVALEELAKLTEHSQRRGIKLSFLIIEAIKAYNLTLGR